MIKTVDPLNRLTKNTTPTKTPGRKGSEGESSASKTRGFTRNQHCGS